MVDRTQFIKLDIVNQVCAALGEDPIEDLETDQRTHAIVIRAKYAATVESALTKTAWRFATTKAALSKLTAAPTNRWSAAFQLPNDLVKLLFTWPPGRYERQGQRILSNNNQLEIDYIRNIESNYWPAWFTRYAVARLVMVCCKGITGDDPSRMMELELNAAESDGLTQDAQEQPNQEILPSAFIDCRY